MEVALWKAAVGEWDLCPIWDLGIYTGNKTTVGSWVLGNHIVSGDGSLWNGETTSQRYDYTTAGSR
jgi:hypothetical protein